MGKNHPTPHDSGFKGAMQDIRVAREFLQKFLPADIKKIVNFDKLQIQKETFVDKHMQLRESDIVYSTEFRGKNGFIYLLIEHQSFKDPLIAFRLIRYMINILELYLKQTGQKHLAVIYPMVFYNGSETWDTPLDVFSLFGDQAELAKKILFGPYQLIDTHKISDNELTNLLWAGTFVKVMKHIRSGEIFDVLRGMKQEFRQVELQNGIDFIYNMFKYVSEAADIKFNEFKQVIEETLTSEAGEQIMTLAQQLRNEGFEKGMIQGIAKGVAEGKAEGRAEGRVEGEKIGIAKGEQMGFTRCRQEFSKNIARKLLKKGAEISEISELTGLPEEDIKELEKLK